MKIEKSVPMRKDANTQKWLNEEYPKIKKKSLTFLSTLVLLKEKHFGKIYKVIKRG
jgi:hypothetical protein